MTSQTTESSVEYAPLGCEMFITFQEMILCINLYSIERLPPNFYADNPTDFYGGDYVEYEVNAIYVPTFGEWEPIVPQHTVDTFAALYERDIEKCIIDSLIEDAEDYIAPYKDGEPFYY